MQDFNENSGNPIPPSEPNVPDTNNTPNPVGAEPEHQAPPQPPAQPPYGNVPQQPMYPGQNQQNGPRADQYHQDPYQQNQFPNWQPPIQQKKNDGKATVSLVLGIVGLISSCCTGGASAIIGIVGLVFGILAYRDRNMYPSSSTMSIIGIILSVLTIVSSIITLVAFLLFGITSSEIFEGEIHDFYDNHYITILSLLSR